MTITNVTCRKYHETHKEQIRSKAKEYKEKNKEKISLQRKAHRQLHKEEIAEYNRQYVLSHKEDAKVKREKNKERDIEKDREYRIKNKDKEKARVLKNRPHINETKRARRKLLRDRAELEKKQYYLDHKEEIDRANQEILIQRQEKMREYKSLYNKNRRKTDKKFKLLLNIRSLIGVALSKQNTRKSDSSIRLTGCSVGDLKSHIESLFSSGMSWDNHGLHGWHIDHIKPCSFFDLTIPEEQAKCFHYSNLQPLWARDNLIKSSLYNGKFYGKSARLPPDEYVASIGSSIN